MLEMSTQVNFLNCNIDPVVTHHNDEINIAFYKGDVEVLQITIDKFNCWNLPDMLLKEMGEKDTEELEEECIQLTCRIEELEGRIEEYENNLQEYKDKLTESCSPF